MVWHAQRLFLNYELQIKNATEADEEVEEAVRRLRVVDVGSAFDRLKTSPKLAAVMDKLATGLNRRRDNMEDPSDVVQSLKELAIKKFGTGPLVSTKMDPFSDGVNVDLVERFLFILFSFYLLIIFYFSLVKRRTKNSKDPLEDPR